MTEDRALADEVRRRLGWSWAVLAKFLCRQRRVVIRWFDGHHRMPAEARLALVELLMALETGVIPAWLDPIGTANTYPQGNAFRRGEHAWRKSLGLPPLTYQPECVDSEVGPLPERPQ